MSTAKRMSKEVKQMTSSTIRIEIPDGKVRELMERLDRAQEEIYECYSELQRLGVVTVKEETASCN